MTDDYPSSDHKTAFEVRVLGFVQMTLKTLCSKGFSPNQAVQLIAQKELQVGPLPMTWGLAEATLFLYLNANHGATGFGQEIDLFEFYDFEKSHKNSDEGGTPF